MVKTIARGASRPQLHFKSEPDFAHHFQAVNRTARLSWDPKGDGLVALVVLWAQQEAATQLVTAHREKCPDQCLCVKGAHLFVYHEFIGMYAFTRFPRGCEVFDIFPTLFLGWQSRPQEFASRARRLDIVSCWVPCTMFGTSASPTVWLLFLIPLPIHNFVTNCFGHGSQFEHSKSFHVRNIFFPAFLDSLSIWFHIK